MDENQIQYYERVVKTMPVKVLLNHDIIKKNDSLKYYFGLFGDLPLPIGVRDWNFG